MDTVQRMFLAEVASTGYIVPMSQWAVDECSPYAVRLRAGAQPRNGWLLAQVRL